MIRLNRITDYAVVVLTQLARAPNEVRTAPQLAEDSAVPLPTVSKLLKQLAHEGVIVSHRGVNGGYTLARAPEDISVLEIIGALEGPVALTSCVDGSHSTCEVETLCPMRGNWNRVNDAIRGALLQVTLADMAGPMLGRALPETAETCTAN